MTKRERRQRIARLERWFVMARAQEKLIGQWPKWDAFLKQHPDAGKIDAAMLYDLFLLAIDRDAE